MAGERVFVAGGTGAIGRRLLPALVDRGYAVTATTRSPAKRALVATLGAEPVVCDALDRDGLFAAVAEARPQVVIHELTDLPRELDADPGRFDEQLAGTIRLRTAGTRHLVDAAIHAGAERVIAQSISFVYAPIGRAVKGEDEPLNDQASEPQRRSVAGVRALESAVLETPGIDGVVLRYGYFYGLGTYYAPEGSITDRVRRGGYPIRGDGDDVASFIHVDDAAEATVLAIAGPPGIYNITDDEPAPMRAWLPIFAEAAGGPAPERVPAPSRPFERGASNAKAKRELRWTLTFPTWRDGFAASFRDAGGAP